MGVDELAEATGGAERQAKELQLVGRCAGTVRKQLKALLAHFGIGLVGKQLDAVVEGSDRAHQVVAEPGTKQAGEVDRVHAR